MSFMLSFTNSLSGSSKDLNSHLAEKQIFRNKTIALMDCNNFFVSCERSVKPYLKNRPVVVLSNNDACVIARSNEAKALGIKMGEPVFQCRELLQRHNVVTCTGNFKLYDAISKRIMRILARLTYELEVYSIDEAFFTLSANQSLEDALEIKNIIEKQTSIPVSIGIARTKTLAKIANHIAKKDILGVASLYAPDDVQDALIDYHLADIPVDEVWGIGRAYAKSLKMFGVRTALDLKYANRRWLRQELKVNGLKTAMELNGYLCLPLSADVNDVKSVMHSRSFSHKISSYSELEHIIAKFALEASARLREQKKLATRIGVFANIADDDFSWRGRFVEASNKLLMPSDYPAKLSTAAKSAFAKIYEKGGLYRRLGLILTELTDLDSIQLPLIEGVDGLLERSEAEARLISSVDQINRKFGVNTLLPLSAKLATKSK
jgi:DNA polymerase V